MLSLAEREEIALAHTRGEGVRATARLIGWDQPYLTAIAEELNTRQRACLGFYTPQEVFQQMLLDGQSANGEGVASTN